MAVKELNMEKLEDLKGQVESFGFDEKQRNKLITEKMAPNERCCRTKISSPG